MSRPEVGESAEPPPSSASEERRLKHWSEREIDPRARERAARWLELQPLAAGGGRGGEGGAGGEGGVMARLRSNALTLQAAHTELSARSEQEPADSYAAEWFLDNYYLVRAATQQALKDLPPSYFRQLPRLAEGAPFAGEPRVYALAHAAVEESEARLELEGVEELLAAYQQGAPLSMGELWAFPAMARVVVIERLAESMRRIVEEEGAPRLGGEAGAPEPVAPSDDDQVANCVVSLRAIRNYDWNEFFEGLSVVEGVLRKESAGVYPKMEFLTRDRYRKVIEQVAKGAGRDEAAVARSAVAYADEAAAGASPADVGLHAVERRAHVGYYLLGEGVKRLKRELGYRGGAAERFRSWVYGNPAVVYLGSILLTTAALLAVALSHAAAGGGGAWMQLLVLVVLLVPAVGIGVGVVNLVLSHLLPPRLLPKLDLSAGVPAELRTAVAVPAMLGSAEGIEELMLQLERHYLGNPGEELLFALLTDFVDAEAADRPGDQELLELAKEGVEELNLRHGSPGRRPFYLFHRRRVWAERQGVWMGWERKRGKLVEFNRLLRGDPGTSYDVQQGDLSKLSGVRFVLTLDSDTRLPPAAAHRLVGTLAHPLNRAEFDEQGRVVAGYALLQPRTDILPESANATYYSRLFVGENGLDLYTLAVSDVYQDLFGAGIYVGKGLYSVDDFMRALSGKVPENSVLSHDLLEGIYGGAGLVADVVLYEEYPPTYLAQTLRMQRWIRGDWQLLPWLTGAFSGEWKAGMRLSPLGAWQVFDNLRRSLLMPSVVLMLLLGWTLFPGLPLVWTLMALGTLLVPLFGSAVGALLAALDREEEVGGAWEFALPWHQFGQALRRFVITVAFIPHEAVTVLSSVGTTLYRLFVSRRNLLEWRTAAQAARAATELTFAGTALRMGGALLLAAAATLLVILVRPAALLVAWPVLALWLAAPAIAYATGRETAPEAEVLGEEERRRLRRLARRTWLYYEQFVGPDDNWLPPDNVQTGPSPVTAHRTSPTNIGLQFLSALSARDLGYLGLIDLSLRLRQTLRTVSRLEHYRGHLLNWYDTRSLAPLTPRYVSSVDSGNLVGGLIAMREGCFELLGEPVHAPRRWRGLHDTLDVLLETVEASLGPGAELVTHLVAVRDRVAAAVRGAGPHGALLDYLEGEAESELRRLLVEELDRGAFSPEALEAVRGWAERVSYNVRVTQREFEFLAPWRRALDEAEAWEADLGAAAARSLAELREVLADPPTLRELEGRCRAALEPLTEFTRAAESGGPAQAAQWGRELARALTSCAAAARGLVEAFEEIAAMAAAEVDGTDFTFLYDEDRHLLRIGYNVDTERLDDNYYDLLASEARVGSLVGIAKGDLPVRHWLHLGRPLADVRGRATLLSWSGTMFEYLMPNLVARRYPGTLLDQSSVVAVEAQMEHARRNDIPWGTSESGYGRVDSAGTFQYRAFGVPELALDRGQMDDLIVAPYASLLALDVRPRAVLDNLDRLEELGAMGQFGLYEALDFTPARRPLDRPYKLVSSYMAHHQGMILVSLANALLGDRMVERFHADPRISTVELLLQERVPTHAPVAKRSESEQPRPDPLAAGVAERPRRVPVQAPTPQARLLSNGRYSVLITSTGAGYSNYRSTAITRWQGDGTLEEHGTFIYLHDLESGELWSVTRQPTGSAELEEAEFAPHAALFTRLKDGIMSRLAVTVADEDAELRRVTVINQSDEPRRLKLTSYAEVVLGDPAGDLRHPAFSKLFVESSYESELETLLFRRRPRSAEEAALFAAHTVLSHEERPAGAALEHESARLHFLGRGRDLRDPQGARGALGGNVGATLDPVAALAETVELAPHSQRTFTFMTAYGATRAELLANVERLRRPGAVDRAFELARNRSRQDLLRGHIGPEELRQIQLLLSALLYPSARLRAEPATLAANELGQSGLWGQGISGDYPILLARVGEHDELQLVSDLVQAHGYLRRRGLKVDVVILNAKESGYSQELQGRLRWLLSRTGGDDWLDARGGIFLVREDQLAPADLTLLRSVARVLVDGGAGSLAQQLEKLNLPTEELPLHQPIGAAADDADAAAPPARPTGLAFDNGWGGFSEDGREYQIYLRGGELPPAPWANVIANEEAGFLTTEAGMGSSWAVNSGENRLTPWHNDPVSDPPAEVVYLRDEETAAVWSATPLPSSLESPFLVRHGAGYTIWEHASHGIEQELEAFVAAEAPVKLVRLKLHNRTEQERRLTVTYYAPWVLGVDRSASQLFVVPSYDAERCALLARNRYNAEFGRREAFLASNKAPHGLTTDRTEFLGRLGDPSLPDALRRIGLSGSVAAGADQCAALQLHVDLPPGGSEEVLFVLGEAASREEALELAERYRDLGRLGAHREEAQAKWEGLLGKVQVDTPDPAMNLLTNRWLTYQTLAARLWGRSGFYQSSGAYGFRDQLQDVLSLLYTAPHLAREQLLRAAAHQFEEGDVLHWWHPPSGRGVRTRITDDLLWLPYVTARYLEVTGDGGVLEEEAPYLTGAPLAPDDHERYDHYERGGSGTLLEHCLRAIERGATVGRNGLPLMGGGDWNDGMNRVGIGGQGESVWLAWFLVVTLREFATVLNGVGRGAEAAALRERADGYARAAEANAWDGDWYLRAFYDDGSPIGSSDNRECRIDAIAQSWSLFALGDHERGRHALAKVDELLVSEEDGLIKLFTPAFDKTPRDPGYIKGYLPGVRENGGQYTHAAIWTAWAFTALREGDRAFELYQLLTPVRHGDSRAAAERYMVEPYVVAADVYSLEPHVGRGGWTWYTGSAAWFYRFALEAILGLKKVGESLHFDPSLPSSWSGYEATWHEGEGSYRIRVVAGQGGGGRSQVVRRVTLDGEERHDRTVPLLKDGADHEVLVELG